MAQNKQQNDGSPAIRDSKRKSRIGHWVRVAVMFLSGGFIFPHALTEDDDISEYDADKDPEVKKR